MDCLIKSIYAGLIIGIGGIIYLSLNNPIIGAFLFSFGLLTIIIQQFNLFTGKIGFIKTREQLIEECSELQKPITKYLRGKGNYENICEEMADVIICLDWLQHILDIKNEDIQKWIDYKTECTLGRI